jgi:cation-transporting ATPase 13A3/4/5
MGIINTTVFTLGGFSIAWVTYNNAVQLYSLVKGSAEVTVRVLRDGKLNSVRASELVPGDVIAVDSGPFVVDAVLVAGQAVVDESSLTGESMPVHKVALETVDAAKAYSAKTHKKSTLFAGTTVLQGGDGEKESYAFVLKTGGNTDKGKEVREILFQNSPQFKFDVQVSWVVGILVLYAAFGFCMTLYFLGDYPVYGWFYGMYVVGAALPPLLPTVFVVSVGIGAKRLEKKGVVCSDPQRILVAGKVRVCCFDKTGTLTKAGMEFNGVRSFRNSEFESAHSKEAPVNSVLEAGMASCHTLSKVTIRKREALFGSAVDKMMFDATGWSLTQADDGNTVANGKRTIKVVRRFDFDHEKQSSSVIVQEGDKYTVFVKGSAEALAKLLKSVPGTFQGMADYYSREGCYTLAIGFRECSSAEASVLKSGAPLERADVEAGLDLAGLITFRNDVKSDSAGAIAALKEGKCRTVMLTGDHAMTGVYIARKVGMLDAHRAILRSAALNGSGGIEWVDEDGKSAVYSEDKELVVLGEIWRALSAEEQLKLLPHVRIFARTSPNDKLSVVQKYISQGLVVSMCGDGGNDCGALRAAHVGIALSDAEASIVSPFTGVSKSCMSVVDVLLEGRSTLATALACYKYMVMVGHLSCTKY